MAGLQPSDQALAALSEHDRSELKKGSSSEEGKGSSSEEGISVHDNSNASLDLGDDYPTEEEKLTLRRMPDRIEFAAFLIAFVEVRRGSAGGHVAGS